MQEEHLTKNYTFFSSNLQTFRNHHIVLLSFSEIFFQSSTLSGASCRTHTVTSDLNRIFLLV